jgi:DNA mismatch repair protein MutS2
MPGTKPRGRVVAAQDVKAGDRLWAEPLQSWVTVLNAPGSSDKVRVERSGLRIEIPVSGLRTDNGESGGSETAPAARSGVSYDVSDQVRGEVDLRGMTAEEALARLDAYMDGAVLGALSEVRIIHGKGTGVLRQAVGKWLKGRPDVATHKLGETWEGGTGVTVARLK